ncbi:MAG TPA: hypothetical protein PK509_12350 [Catalimonadaceae bacterium]|nr:hypothetical protein [Catalimonadaceae bacterium]
MEYTVNQQNIQKYAERLTNDLCRMFFVNKAFISGPEILSFNPVNQLNLLIVKNIFLNWQKEALKLKSPYFDYEDEGVKQALKTFMNKLSNHIKVYRYDFEPLVTKSICDFILLSAAPQDFFTKEVEALASPKVPVTLLKEFSKYIRVNKFVMEQVVAEIEASGYTETFGGETIRFVMKSLNENPDKIEAADAALKGLLEQLPADVTDFVCMPKPLVTRPAFLDQPKPEPEKEPEYVPVTKPVFEKEEPAPEPFFVAPEPEIVPEPVAEIEPEPVAEIEVASEPVAEVEEVVEVNSVWEEPAAETEIEAIQVPSVEAQSEEIETPAPEPQPEEPVFGKNLVQKTRPVRTEASDLAKDPITLNETLRKSEQRTTLADALQVKTAAAPFKTLVPMHYRFTFISNLFAGSQQAWAEAVEKIDATNSYEEAIAMLKAEYAGTYNWDKEEDNVAILFNYVERKF